MCLASVDYRQYFCVKLLSLPWWGVWVEIGNGENVTVVRVCHPLGGECGLKSVKRIMLPGLAWVTPLAGNVS